jgi:multiple antibiotic resistance protein
MLVSRALHNWSMLLAVLAILIVAALVGAGVLQILGVSLEAFSIAGGGVLSWIGFNMMRGSSPQRRASP